MGTDYSKIGREQTEGKLAPKPPRMSPAELAKRQKAINEERLKAAEKQQLREEANKLQNTVAKLDEINAKEQPKGKRSKDEREREFIVAVEMILGHPLFEWQKEWIKEIRKASFEGRPIQLTLEQVRQRRGY